MRSQLNVRNLVRAAVLAAVAILLMTPLFELPLPFMPPWLKIDISTMPVLLSGFALGPWWGLATQIVKSVAHIPIGTTGGIGELADLLVGSAMMLPAALIYARNRTRKAALMGMGLGIVCMTVVAVLANNFILLPLYFGANAGSAIAGAMGTESLIQGVSSYLIYAIVPFNIIKGALISGVTFLLYRYLRRFLHDPRR